MGAWQLSHTMDVAAAGDCVVAAVSWRLLRRPAGAHFAVEKQLAVAWRPASCRLPLHHGVAKCLPSSFPRSGTRGVCGT